MKTKNIRLILDIVLKVALITLYSKNFFGLKYHEIAGIAVLIPILIHIIINIKMINGLVKNVLKVPMNMKVCLVVDILLLFTIIRVGISGVLISKTILTSIGTKNSLVKLYHMSIGGWSVILLGIHIGLHICRK